MGGGMSCGVRALGTSIFLSSLGSVRLDDFGSRLDNPFDRPGILTLMYRLCRFCVGGASASPFFRRLADFRLAKANAESEVSKSRFSVAQKRTRF